jgi:hypothetical protein
LILKRDVSPADGGVVGTSPVLPAYDPKVIEQFAEKLYRKASAFVAGSIVIGASLGSAFGAVPLTSLGAAWPIPSYLGFATLLLGGLLGGLVGYVIGDTRSFGYRLQAQSALCQLQSERNTAVLARAVSARFGAGASPRAACSSGRRRSAARGRRSPASPVAAGLGGARRLAATTS